MKTIITGVIAVTVTVAIGVTLVKAQIIFADGSQQVTAFRDFVPPPGTAFNYTVVTPGGSVPTALVMAAAPVPAGKELVIRQITSYVGLGGFLLYSDIQALTDPIPILSFPAAVSGGINLTFPDGLLVVDEGRVPTISGPLYDFGTCCNQEITILGYFRDKV